MGMFRDLKKLSDQERELRRRARAQAAAPAGPPGATHLQQRAERAGAGPRH